MDDKKRSFFMYVFRIMDGENVFCYVNTIGPVDVLIPDYESCIITRFSFGFVKLKNHDDIGGTIT